MKIQNSGKRAIALVLCAGLAISLAACQENPEGSIVAHKDMDKLISQAAASDPDKVQAGKIVQDVSKNNESYQVNLDSENLGIKAQVDAQVEVPQVEKLSIYRVQQKKLDQSFIDKVRKELLGDQPLYNGRALRVSTQADIERKITNLRREMEEEVAYNRQAMAENGSTQEEIEESVRQTRENYQGMINELQEQYETARDELNAKLTGLTGGAEDYMVKPFEVLELLVRMDKAMARNQPNSGVIRVLDLEINLEEHRVRKAGAEVPLKPMEFDLLVALAKNKNAAISREDLIGLVWGSDYLGESRTVDEHIGQLRKKLGLQNAIKTVPKLGYRLEDY